MGKVLNIAPVFWSNLDLKFPKSSSFFPVKFYSIWHCNSLLLLLSQKSCPLLIFADTERLGDIFQTLLTTSEVYSKPCSTFKMEHFVKAVNDWKPFLRKAPSQMFDRVVKTPLSTVLQLLLYSLYWSPCLTSVPLPQKIKCNNKHH